MKCETVLGFEEIKKRLVDHCSSLNAKEIAMNLKPMTDIEKIKEALNETKEAYISYHREVEQPIGGTRDIRRACKKSRKDMVLTQEEFIDISNSLYAYRRMKKFFLEKYASYPLLTLWVQDMDTHDKLEKKLSSVFDKKGVLQDNASPKLSQLRMRIINLKERLKIELQHILQDKDNQKYFQETLVTQRNNRYVIPVKQEYRYVFEGIIHDKSSTGATLYIEPMKMVQLNNDLQEVLAEEEKEIQRIYRILSEEIKKYSASLLAASECVSHVEFVYGKAALAIEQSGVAAIIKDEQEVNLIKARHPLIPAESVVPIDISVGEGYKILLITGSNTGGKTVSLKTLGLLALMNQAGLFIPAAQGSELPVFTSIYADIGDEQSIEENLSTFSAHMTQIVEILNEVGPKDLVLLDELGSGTDPEEGSALAVAILDYFRKLGPCMMVTTHYNELKNYAYHTEGVENGHVEFDEETLKPLYRLYIGVAGSSHALSIGRRLGLPEEIIIQAGEYKKGARHGDMDQLLQVLNEQLHQAQVKDEQLQIELEKSRKIRIDLEREKKKLEEKKRKIIEKAQEEALTLKRSLRIESEQIIKELKDSFNEGNDAKRQRRIQEARKAVAGIEVPHISGEERRLLGAEDLVVGAVVYIVNLQSLGTVISIQGKRIQVDVNGLKAMVSPEDLRMATREETNKELREMSPRIKERKRSGLAVLRQQQASTELNIIGQTVDSAVIEVGRFIDQALLAGISPVRIIHGKGAGVLRAGVRDYLKSLPMVVRFEQGGYDEGGAGVTIVYLK